MAHVVGTPHEASPVATTPCLVLVDLDHKGSEWAKLARLVPALGYTLRGACGPAYAGPGVESVDVLRWTPAVSGVPQRRAHHRTHTSVCLFLLAVDMIRRWHVNAPTGGIVYFVTGGGLVASMCEVIEASVFAELRDSLLHTWELRIVDTAEAIIADCMAPRDSNRH